MKKALKVYIAPKGTSGVRKEQKELILKKDYGIRGDKFAGKKLEQSVMIVGDIAYKIAKENGIALPEAALGENILLNFDPHTLNIGDRLQIGSAILEISLACTLCNHLLVYDKRLPKLILKHRGIYCKVVKDGIIKAEDKVILLESEVIKG